MIGQKVKRRVPAGGERKVIEHLPSIPSLEFKECIGQGHFSHVYQAIYKGKYPAAVKVIERGSEKLIQNEVELLNELKGSENIVQLYKVIHDEESGLTMLVFEFLKSAKMDSIFRQLDIRKVRFLLKSILSGLKDSHEKGIIHRDIKIGNINIAPRFKYVKILDWGCGTHITSDMSPKAGSRQCRSPEMLLGYRNYGTKGDIWAVGIFILYLLSCGEIPWKARTTANALEIMSKYFGGNALRNIAANLDLEINEELAAKWTPEPVKSIESSFSSEMNNLFNEDLIDLMHKLLELNIEKRISASEALKHPFFD